MIIYRIINLLYYKKTDVARKTGKKNFRTDTEASALRANYLTFIPFTALKGEYT